MRDFKPTGSLILYIHRCVNKTSSGERNYQPGGDTGLRWDCPDSSPFMVITESFQPIPEHPNPEGNTILAVFRFTTWQI